ncbi:unnamed protein product [Auanema sp. JU1783]|nr:unnamed protein product [Auanema sp. JU1783]
MSTMTTTKIILIALPSAFVLTVFIVFVGFVLWNLHLFIVPIPKMSFDCASMKYENNLEDYILNRTVVQERNISELTGRGCWSIRKQWYFPTEVPDSMEVHHPLYLIRLVSKDYEFVEEVLSMLYSPIHFFCFPISSNSTERFQIKMRFLSKCIINVIVPDDTFDISDPHKEFEAYEACLDKMNNFPWRHLIIMQENEIPLQSVHFIADYARRLGEAAKIGKNGVSEEQIRILQQEQDTTHKLETTSVNVKHELDYVKKATCSYMGGRREPIILSTEFHKIFFDIVKNYMTKQQLSKCQGIHSNATYPVCISEKFDRQGNCVLGMESYQFAQSSRNLFIRSDPQFDLGFVQCVHKLVFDRTYNTSFYKIRYGSH